MIWSGVAGARRAPSAKGLACQYVRSRECARICQGARRRHGRSAQPRCSRGLWAVGSRVGWAACRQESRGCAQSTHGPSSHAKATNSASAVPGVGMMPMHGRHKLRSHASTGTDCNLTQWGVRWQPRPKRRCNPHLDVGRASTRRLTSRKVPRGPSAHMGPSGGIRRGSRGSGESRNPPPAKGPAIAPISHIIVRALSRVPVSGKRSRAAPAATGLSSVGAVAVRAAVRAAAAAAPPPQRRRARRRARRP